MQKKSLAYDWFREPQRRLVIVDRNGSERPCVACSCVPDARRVGAGLACPRPRPPQHHGTTIATVSTPFASDPPLHACEMKP